MLRNYFETSGYNFLEAESSEEAWLIARTYRGTIDLLVTDISKATMNDPKLGVPLTEVEPKAKVLFISGHPEDFLPDDRCELNIIQKPFAKETLLDRLKQILN